VYLLSSVLTPIIVSFIRWIMPGIKMQITAIKAVENLIGEGLGVLKGVLETVTGINFAEAAKYVELKEEEFNTFLENLGKPETWKIVLDAVIAWISGVFGPGLTISIATILETAKNKFSDVAGAIKGFIDWIWNNTPQFIKDLLTGPAGGGAQPGTPTSPAATTATSTATSATNALTYGYTGATGYTGTAKPPVYTPSTFNLNVTVPKEDYLQTIVSKIKNFIMLGIQAKAGG